MNSFLYWRALLLALLLTIATFLFFSVSLAAPAAQGLACATAPAASDPTPTVCLSNVVVVFDGISPENQFVVSWRTLKNEKGQVKLANGATYEDVRGASYQGKTHYVVVSNLEARTGYSFDIISGGKTYNNADAHWNIHTGPAIQSGTPYVIYGRVSNPDGSEADGALVYAQARDGDNQGTQGRSAWLASVIAVADGGNFFNLNLDLARTNNNVQEYAFNPDSDRVLIVASGAQGTASKGFKISDLHPPAPPPSLILGSSGTGSAVTATATQMPPTPTPTISLTPTATLTPISPTPSETQTFVPPTRTPAPITETAQARTTEDIAQTTQEAAATDTAPPQMTPVAFPAGEQIEPQRTRIFAGVPTAVPPQQNGNNPILVILALVLIVGAILLGLAAFFITRNK